MTHPNAQQHLIVRAPTGGLHGRVSVPGDKSISHRALMLGALAEGASHVAGFLPSADCLATLGCVRALGVTVARHDATTLTIHGRGLHGLRAPEAPLDCVRSGTTMRLLAGILAGQAFASTLTGAPQLLRRPMRRITTPLRAMGADITDVAGHGPLTIRPGELHGLDHTLPVASAQVKSAILLAGLYAEGVTTVRQPGPARDHTERMLAAQAGKAAHRHIGTSNIPNPVFDDRTITLAPIERLAPLEITVPGDVSSAAFLWVAALLVPGSEVTVAGVGVNPTRTGLEDVLRAMGADLARTDARAQGGEPVADVTARASRLVGAEVHGPTVVRMIDEFPVLAVAATQARGTTVVRDAAELRVKETDRIAVIAAELRKLGARIEPRPDGFVVQGPTPLRGAPVDGHGDHRIAMALAVAGLLAEGETVIAGADCIADSFPGFADVLMGLGGRLELAPSRTAAGGPS
jgi:3-phosphoshikimate 1-carboxyvinyltransferase